MLAAALGLLALAACAKSAKQPDVTADLPGTPVDSVTVALWRMDETGGTRAADAGPSRLDAIAGPDTRTIFGRFRGARLFTRSINSFLYVPYSPLLDLAVGAQHRGLDRPERLHAVRGLPHRHPVVADDRRAQLDVLDRRLQLRARLRPAEFGTGAGPAWHQDVRRGASRPAGSCSSSSPRTRARRACSTR